MPSPKSISVREIHEALDRMVDAINKRYKGKTKRLIVLGIANGGMELARRIAGRLSARCGTLDISFHRDDIDRHPIPKEYAPTVVPWDVSGETVILIDDVLFSGRTVNAALNELFDQGRPERVELAVLVDRGGRRLPVKADYIGMSLDVPSAAKVQVCLTENPNKDTVNIIEKGN